MPIDKPNVIALPPLILLATLAAAIALELVLPVVFLPPLYTVWSIAAGVVLVLAGVGLAATGLVAFKRAKTNVDPRQPALVLVETGPYRFTRNPMYVGMITVMLGVTLAGSLDWGLPLAVLLWLTLYHGVVLREEAYLRGKFGAPYEAYLNRTRRWL